MLRVDETVNKCHNDAWKPARRIATLLSNQLSAPYLNKRKGNRMSRGAVRARLLYPIHTHPVRTHTYIDLISFTLNNHYTRVEPQQIVGKPLLYCLQHPVRFSSSLKDCFKGGCVLQRAQPLSMYRYYFYTTHPSPCTLVPAWLLA